MHLLQTQALQVVAQAKKRDSEMIVLEWLGLSAVVVVAFVVSSWISSPVRGTRRE